VAMPALKPTTSGRDQRDENPHRGGHHNLGHRDGNAFAPRELPRDLRFDKPDHERGQQDRCRPPL